MYKLNQHIFNKDGKEFVVVRIIESNSIEEGRSSLNYLLTKLEEFKEGIEGSHSLVNIENFFPSMDELRRHLVNEAMKLEPS